MGTSERFAKVITLGIDFQVICDTIYHLIMKLGSESLGYLHTDFHCSTPWLSSVVRSCVCVCVCVCVCMYVLRGGRG